MFTAQRLSLDVVAGVICGAFFSVSATGATLPLAWWFLLPACTWLVYAWDHLLDARRRDGHRPSNPRHRFYQDHFRLLVTVSVGMTVALPVGALLWLPAPLLLAGGLLGLAATAHLLTARLRQAPTLPKELSAAIVYTAGIWFGPLMTMPGPIAPWTLLLAGLHLVAAASNLAVFSIFELSLDQADRQVSLVRSWGAGTTRNGVRGLTSLALATAVGGATLGPDRLVVHFVVLSLVVVTPTLLDACPRFFSGAFRYRAFGDLAFVLMSLPAWIRS
jgi:hypothetical protein